MKTGDLLQGCIYSTLRLKNFAGSATLSYESDSNLTRAYITCRRIKRRV